MITEILLHVALEFWVWIILYIEGRISNLKDVSLQQILEHL